MELTQERFKEFFIYEENTGNFKRKKLIRGKGVIGEIVGFKDSDGYLKIRFDKKGYFLHRLAWLYVYGFFPSMTIDHINGIKTDNRIKNLRDVSMKINNQNIKTACKNSKTKILGVCWHKLKLKYMAALKKDGKTIFLGYFDNVEEAQKAYINAKRKHHEGCTI